MPVSEAQSRANKKYHSKMKEDPNYLQKNRERTKLYFKKYYDSVKNEEWFKEANRLRANRFYTKNRENEKSKKLQYYYNNKEIIKEKQKFKNNLIIEEELKQQSQIKQILDKMIILINQTEEERTCDLVVGSEVVSTHSSIADEELTGDRPSLQSESIHKV